MKFAFALGGLVFLLSLAHVQRDASASEPGRGAGLNAEARIDVSGRQRMLSQRIAKAPCAGTLLQDEAYFVEARDAIQLFDVSLRILRDGGSKEIVRPERNVPVLEAIDVVEGHWMWLGPTYWEISHGDVDDTYLAAMIEENLLLLDHANRLVSEIELSYNGAGMRSDALRTVNRSGLMRMRSERLVKQLCFVLQGFRAQEYVLDAAANLRAMDAELSDLQNGSQSERIVVPPTDTHRQTLVLMRAKFTELSAGVDAVMSGGEVTRDQYAQIYQTAVTFVDFADALTRAYAAHFEANP